MTERIRFFSHLPHGQSVPDHAEVVSTFNGEHHGRYGVLLELFAEDTGYEGIDPAPVYGFSLPDPLPRFRKVYIDALAMPGLRPAPQVGAEWKAAVPKRRNAA